MDPCYKGILIMRRAGGTCQHLLSAPLFPHPALYCTVFTLPFIALTLEIRYNSHKEQQHQRNKSHNKRWEKGIPVNDIYVGRFPRWGSEAVWKDIPKEDSPSVHFASWYDGFFADFLSFFFPFLWPPCLPVAPFGCLWFGKVFMGAKI